MLRRDQRRAATFALYQHDLTGRPVEELIDPRAQEFTKALAQAVLEHKDELDELISRYSEGWALDRIAPLERSILRVALLEALHPDAVPGDTPIPAEGAIEEAVETAKTYCGVDAPAFVNGILGTALREVRDNPAPR